MEKKVIRLEEYMSEQVFLTNIFDEDFKAEYNGTEFTLKSKREYTMDRGKAQIILSQMAIKYFDGVESVKVDELGNPMTPKYKEFYNLVIKEEVKRDESLSDLGIKEVEKEKEEDFADLKEIDNKNKWTLDGISYSNFGEYMTACRRKKEEIKKREAAERELAIQENKTEEEKLKESKAKKIQKTESEDDFEETPDDGEEDEE